MSDNRRPKLRLGPEAAKLAETETGALESDLLETRIVELKKGADTPTANDGALEDIRPQIQKMALDLADMKAHVQTINESLLTIQTMIVALTAKKSEEIQSALEYINERVQAHQILVAEMTQLDTPRLSMLQDNLRKFQQRQMAEPEFEKEQSEPDREL